MYQNLLASVSVNKHKEKVTKINILTIYQVKLLLSCR